jgi:hypothetical protein
MWDAPWQPPIRTGWTNVKAYGSVHKRYVPGDNEHVSDDIADIAQEDILSKEIQYLCWFIVQNI